jgi:hypothetical protein
MGYTLIEDDTPPAKATGYQLVDSAPPPSNLAVAGNAANKGIATLVDSVLNAPTDIYNLGAAGVGSALVASGHPNLAPDVLAHPDLARRALQWLGVLDAKNEPSTPGQRILDTAVQGVPTALVSPASSVRQLLTNAAIGGASTGTGEVVTQATGSPNAGFLASMAVPSAAANKGAVARNAQQKTDALAARQQQRSADDATRRVAIENGYTVSPAQVNPTLPNRLREGLAGKVKFEHEASARNREAGNAIARHEASMPPNQPITQENLAAAREPLYAPYREVVALPVRNQVNAASGYTDWAAPTQASAGFDPANALQDLIDTRRNAQLAWDEYGRQRLRPAREDALAYDARAEDLENQIENYAAQHGDATLVDRLRAARVALAKNHDVDRANIAGGGDINQRVIARADQADRPLTGGLKIIGDFANTNPRVTKSEAQTGANVNALDSLGGLIGGATGGLAGGMEGGGAGALAGYLGMHALRDFALQSALRAGRNPNVLPNYQGGAMLRGQTRLGGLLGDDDPALLQSVLPISAMMSQYQ